MKTIFRHIKVKLMETKDKQKNYLKKAVSKIDIAHTGEYLIVVIKMEF